MVNAIFVAVFVLFERLPGVIIRVIVDEFVTLGAKEH